MVLHEKLPPDESLSEEDPLSAEYAQRALEILEEVDDTPPGKIDNLQKRVETEIKSVADDGSIQRTNKLKELLEKDKSKRIWLKNPQEKVSPEEAEKREDENGFLCVLNENGEYEKISADRLREVYGISDDTKRQRFIKLAFSDPDNPLRRTDLMRLDFLPRKLNKKGESPVFNNIRYNFPKSFRLQASEATAKIDTQRDTITKLSDDYGVLNINRGQKSTPYLLRFVSADELMKDPIHAKRLQSKTPMTYLKAKETVSRLQEWDVTQFVPPRSDETSQAYAKRIAPLWDISNLTNIYRKLIDEANFKLQDHDLKKQLLFTAYYINATEDQKRVIEGLLSDYAKDSGTFLSAFQACEFGFGMGDKIIEIATKHGKKAIPIFKQFSEIMKIFEQKAEIVEQMGEDFDETKFYTAITKRGADLLNNIATMDDPGSNLEKFLKETRAYHQDVVSQGALLASIATTTKTIPRAPKEITEMLDNVQVDEFQGGDMVRESDRNSMENASNYKNQSRFNEKNYQTIVGNLQRAYKEIDPGWLEHLIDNIPNDLNNPEVKFVTVKNKKTEKLIGVCKIKPVEGQPNTYYFGTHYVEPEFQKDFGVGKYIEQIARSTLPENAHIIATVATANPTMERHIDINNGIGLKITHEGGSKELIEFEWGYEGNYTTKDVKRFSRERIKAIAKGENPLPAAEENVRIYHTDTSSDNNAEFIQTAQQRFEDGYVLTRVFYDKKGGKSDPSSAYIVFEKTRN